MATDKEIIQQLVKIAEKQQRIINKLAQGLGPQGAPALVMPEANQPNLRPAETLIKALPAALKPGKGVIDVVEVHGNEVHVRFSPGKDSNNAFNALMAVVQKTLPGMTVKTV
jgi:hypothetical protein